MYEDRSSTGEGWGEIVIITLVAGFIAPITLTAWDGQLRHYSDRSCARTTFCFASKFSPHLLAISEFQEANQN